MLELIKNQLIELANINSHSHNPAGIKLVKDWVLAEIKILARELKLELVYEEFDYGIKITKTNCSESSLRLLLMGHLDTVYPLDSSFQSCKLISENKLNGPGVADLKGGILVMLNALKAFEKEAPELSSRLRWQIFLNYDEEIGSIKSSQHFSTLAKDNNLALIFEPGLPDGSLAYRRKGTGNFVFEIHGKAAHVGRNFAEGLNAIVIASELSLKLHLLNTLHPELTVNIGKISGGTATNTVADFASVEINVRINETEDVDIFNSKLKSIIDELVQKHPQALIKSSGAFNRKPKIPNAKTDELIGLIQECSRELGIVSGLKDTGGCCDGNNLHELGLTNVDNLGVLGGNIHSPEEYVLLDSIPQRIALIKAVLIKLASKN